MDIAKILEYQKLDFIIYKANREFSSSEENVKATKIRNIVNEIAENLVRLDKESADVYSDIDRLKNVLDNFNKKVKATPLSGAKTLEQADKMEDAITLLENELIGLEREMQKAFRRLQEISRETTELTQKLIKLKTELRNAEQAKANKRQEVIAKVAPEGKLMQDMQKNVLDPNDLEIYNRARKANVKMPIVVEYKEGHCAACGMEIKSEVESKLQKSGDIAECPNCRRIVYLK